MKILIFATHQLAAHTLMMQCLTFADTVVATNFDEMAEKLGSLNKLDALLVEQGPKCEQVLRHLLSLETQLPIVMITPQSNSPFEYPGLNIIGHLTYTDPLTVLMRELDQVMSKTSQDEPSEPYSRVPAYLLTQLPFIQTDLYLRLSKAKFLKFIKSGTVMTANELARVLQRKKLQHLYVRSDDSKLFLNQFKDVIAQKMNQLQAGGAAAIETASMVHDMCHQMFHKLGFSTELKEVTEVNINLTLASIGSDPRLQELLDAKVFQQKNYQSSHSVLLAYAACSIAANLAWSSVPTFQKLVLASLMHDISLNDPTLSKFQTRKEIEAQRESLPPANYQAVVNHSNNSADIVRQFGFAIAEVDLIVSQHHERPDGSGFPLGINATKISPLASILIVAHDLVEEVLNQGEKFHLPDFVNSRAQYYSSAVFKMALAGLAQECAPANTLATAK